MAESQDEYAANLELYEKVVAALPEVKRKGKAMPYTSHNGHMFSLFTKEAKLALRLPAGEREAFVERYGTEPVVQYGAVMREYVEIPQELLEDTDGLKHYFELSYEYIGTLKPKYRVALTLRLALGYSVAEIADITDTPFNTVRERLRTGRKKLHRQMSKDPLLVDWLGGRRHEDA